MSICAVWGVVLMIACEHKGWMSRLGTHYLCGSSEGLDKGLELEVIDEEQEVGDGEISEAEDNGSEVS
jgi:hypothetical protein